jgi:hypothetical protein
MKTFTLRSFLILILSLILCTGFTEAGFLTKNNSSAMDFMQPRKAKKAQKKQDAKEKKKKDAIKDNSRKAQKRSYEIQSPEVQARMKQNKKDTEARNKARKKNNKARTKKGAKKYK